MIFKVLSINDQDAVLDLYHRTADYHTLVAGSIPEDCKELFYDLPPGKDIKDKQVIGIYMAQDLIGIIDVVMGYPNHETGFIGLLIIDNVWRGKGIGQQALQYIEKIVRQAGGKWLQLGVVNINHDAMRFWCYLGFKEKALKGPFTYGSKEHYVHLLEKKI